MVLETAIDYLLGTFFPALWDRLLNIVLAPAHYPGMIWILMPMLFTLVMMTIYFGRYRREELGWNTAVGNAMVLLFVSIDLLQKVYPDENPIRALLIFFRTLFTQGFAAEGIVSGIVAGLLLVYALILITADFFHWLPKKLAFFVSSSLPINVLAYFGIIFVYSRMTGNEDLLPLDWYTFLAFIILFVVLYVILRLLQTIEPHKDEKEPMSDAPEPNKVEIVEGVHDNTPPLHEIYIPEDDPAIAGDDEPPEPDGNKYE